MVIALAAVSAAVAGTGLAGSSRESISPGAILDQSNPSRASSCRFTGWVPDSPGDWAAQTFTAGASGNLTDVVVWLWVRDPRVSVAIAPVDSNGQPLVSRPLASVGLPGGATSTYTEITIPFPSLPVDAGKQYALVLSAGAGGTNDWTWKADLGSSLADSTGTRCADGVYGGGRLRVSGDPFGSDADFFFQTYVVPIRHLTVSTSGSGSGVVRGAQGTIDCGTNCSDDFLQATSLTLTATPDLGSTFLRWTGGCTGSNPTCVFTLDGDTAVTAEFREVLVPLTINIVGRGTVTRFPAGPSCAGSCRRRFRGGPVTFTAHPATGWRFGGWHGACRGTGRVCRWTLLHRTGVTAVFLRISRR